jgi:hypothetical protein
MKAWAGTQIGDLPGQPAVPPTRQGGAAKSGVKARSPEEQREHAKRELLGTVLQGLSTSQLGDFANLFSAFSNNAISIRAFPCGADRPEFHFSGSLLSRSDYMQAEREELYSRHGNELSNWTAVMQVARIPVRFGEAPDLDDFDMGPAFPAISVTPLALYRQFE